MNYELWQRLCTRSRRALLRTRRRAYQGRKLGPYRYRPRGDLLYNLAAELQIPIPEVYERLQKLRRDKLREMGLDKLT